MRERCRVKSVEYAEARICLHCFRIICRYIVELSLADSDCSHCVQGEVAKRIERAKPQGFLSKIFRDCGVALHRVNVRAEIERRRARTVQGNRASDRSRRRAEIVTEMQNA